MLFFVYMKKILLLLTTCFIALNVSAQVADFYKEELQFSVDSLWFRMQGDFYLAKRSATTREMQLSFPVPPGTMELIDSFKVYDYRLQLSLAYRRGNSEFIFTVPFDNNDSIVVNIQYRQKIQDSTLSYIITTVQDWLRPLKYASYSLIVPDYCTASHFSLPVDKCINIQNGKFYVWERHFFMPSVDFSFRCKRK